MPQSPRPNNFQEWYDYLNTTIDPSTGQSNLNGVALQEFRNTCYKDIENLRGRPLFVFASNFLSKVANDSPISIDLPDIDGFTDLINSVGPEVKEVDVLILSPGGSPDATERIVNLLRNRFTKVHFLVSHSAYSAGTMLAMSGDSITLTSNAVLGPIDPQINGIPAKQIKRAFINLHERLRQEGENSILVYLPLIKKYDLHLLEICDDSEKLSKNLVKNWLKEYMLKDMTPTRKKSDSARKATNYMADFDTHLLHSRPLDPKKLQNFGLNINFADTELEKLLREAHILLKATFDGLGFVKLYESPNRLSWGVNTKPI